MTVSPLHVLFSAASNGDTKMLLSLIDSGIDLNTQNEFGRTALMNAAALGRIEAVKVLLDKGADPDLRHNGGQTALMEAEREGHLEIAQMLKDASVHRQIAAEEKKKQEAVDLEASIKEASRRVVLLPWGVPKSVKLKLN